MMKRFQVIRTHTSPYLSADFAKIEQNALESVPVITYRTLKDADPNLPPILLTNAHTKLAELPRDLLNRAHLILHPNSGYDHFRSDKTLVNSIPTVVGHEIRANAVAEYSLACVFESLTQLPQHLAWDKTRNWDRKLIKDQVCWIFGHGHIGSIVARSLSDLGAKVIVVDPFLDTKLSYPSYKTWREGNLKVANVVIATCGLNETSQNMFNQEFFALANPEVVFINGARGGLVVELALREFLLEHPKAMAFLDVFQEEPFGHDWHNFPQVWKTSHIAGVHTNLEKDIIAFEQKVLTDFIKLSIDQFKVKYHKELLANKFKQGMLI